MPEMDGISLARNIRATRGIQETPLLLLTSLHDRQCVRNAGAAGFAATLSKPVKRAHLWNRILLSLGKIAAPQQPPPLIPADIDSSHARAFKVLIVEDNAVNQRVAQRMLERLGYRADVAGNGLDALEAMSRNAYALVLLDCQMPEMDGYETAREIRRREQENGRNTPIIALTANAMKGDRDTCLASGMDDFLTKPVHLGDLREMLERHVCARKPFG
jgi:CheY-like chemotaxis protein